MSIKEKCVLVSVEIEKPTMTRKDAKATAEAAMSNNAKAGAINLTKNLYPKHLTAIFEGVEAKARGQVKKGNYMWSRGQYIMLGNRLMEFMTDAAQIELEWKQAVTAFLNNWANVLQDASSELGNMFDANVYPDVTDLGKQFKLKFHFSPVTTDPNDFRFRADDDAVQAELDKRVAESKADRMSGLAVAPLRTIHVGLTDLVDKLNEPPRQHTDKNGITTEKMPIFRDSKVENIIKACDDAIAYGDDVLPASTIAFACEVKRILPSAAFIRSNEANWEQARATAGKLLRDNEELLGEATVEAETAEVSAIPMGIDEVEADEVEATEEVVYDEDEDDDDTSDDASNDTSSTEYDYDEDDGDTEDEPEKPHLDQNLMDALDEAFD
jgi:hypothetical protein